MNCQFSFSDYEHQVEETAISLLKQVRTPVGLAGGMRLLTVAVERDLLKFGDAAELSQVACAAGCGFCCILNVSTLFPEAVAISRYLWQNLSYDQLVLLHDRLEELHIRTRWLSDEERIYLREPCAFLAENDSCLIHRVRPLLCRSITSLEPSLCKEALAMAPFSEHQTVPMNLFQKGLMEATFSGFGEALRRLNLDDRAWRLTSAVLKALSEPEAGDDFLVGRKIPWH